MKNLLLRVSLKYGLILAGVNIVIGILNPFKTLQVQGHWTQFAIITIIVTYGLMITFFVLPHYEFNKKNEDYISFKDAILIGLIVIGLSIIGGQVFNIIKSEFLTQDKTQSQYFKYFSSIAIGLLMQIVVLFLIITIESQWKIFKKAGKPGWAAIIPIYNVFVQLQIIKQSAWWLFWLIFPGVNIIFVIWMTNLLAKRFGKNEGFTIGLLFLPFIFYPLLGLSKLKYIDD